MYVLIYLFSRDDENFAKYWQYLQGLQQYLNLSYIQATNVTEPEPSFLRGAGAVLYEGSAEPSFLRGAGI